MHSRIAMMKLHRLQQAIRRPSVHSIRIHYVVCKRPVQLYRGPRRPRRAYRLPPRRPCSCVRASAWPCPSLLWPFAVAATPLQLLLQVWLSSPKQPRPSSKAVWAEETGSHCPHQLRASRSRPSQPGRLQVHQHGERRLTCHEFGVLIFVPVLLVLARIRLRKQHQQRG